MDSRGSAYGFGCADQPDWLRNMKEITPASVAVNHPAKVPDLIRLEKRLQSQQTVYGVGGGLSGNNIITFDVPNEAPIDFRGGFIFLDVVLGGTPGTYIRLAQGVWTIINKIRVIFGDLKIKFNTTIAFILISFKQEPTLLSKPPLDTICWVWVFNRTETDGVPTRQEHPM